MGYRTLVIINPASANGSTGKLWPELRAALDRVLERWDNQFTIGPGDATRVARQAVLDGYDMLVSVGGDGTMNEVVTGLFVEAKGKDAPRAKLVREGVVIGSVRRGTGGDFARYLGLPSKLPDAVAHLGGDKTRACDLGYLEYVDNNGAPAARGFLNIASFGISGVVDAKVNSTTKALGGGVSFAVGALRGLLAFRNQDVRMKIDGAPFYEGPIALGAVANGHYFGGGMHVAPKAEIDDGLFDVFALTQLGAKEIAKAADIYSGKATETWPTVRTGRGREITAEPVSPSDRVLLDVDGEQPGCLPATFRIVPGAVRLKVA